MNKFITTIFLILALTGCKSLLNNNQGVFGNASKADQKIDTQIRLTENAQSQNNEDRLSHIAAWSKGGVESALDKITNDIPKEVTVAKKMNDRVEALAGQPDFKEVEAIKDIVSDLLNDNTKVREQGSNELNKADKVVIGLQNQVKELNIQREEQIAVAMSQADKNAAKADQYKATLNDMDKWGGLGAVWYGLKKFIIRSMWILGIGSVLFIILRLLASSNPIAGAIFGIFDQIGSWFVKTISVIFPKAVSLAGNVTTGVYNEAKSALTSIVDSVETVKIQSAASGKPATIQDLLNEAETSMSDADKAIIENIKIKLGWVKPPTIIATIINNTDIPKV